MSSLPKRRKHVWENEQVIMLLELWGEKMNAANGMRRRSAYLMRELENKMVPTFPKITSDEIRNKIKNLTQQYRKELSAIEFSGTPSSWPWFDHMHEILKETSFENYSSTIKDSQSVSDNSMPTANTSFEEVKVKNCSSSSPTDFFLNKNIKNETSPERDRIQNDNLMIPNPHREHVYNEDYNDKNHTYHKMVLKKFDSIDQRLDEQLKQQKETDNAMLELERKKLELFEKLVKDHAQLKDAILKKLETSTTDNTL